MRNKTEWRPTKFVPAKKGFRASNDRSEVALGSRFVAGIQVRLYEQLIKQHARGLLLDLGCGKVPLYLVYKEHVTDNICIDWGNTLHRSAHLDYECDLNDCIPLPNDHVDTILLTDVLEHIANPDRLWEEMSRVLKSGGKLILTVPFLYCIHEEPNDYFRYTEYKLKAFCSTNNFEILTLAPYGGFLECLLDLLGKSVAFSHITSATHFWVSNIMVDSFVGRKIFKSTARRFPLGYGLVARKA